MERTNGDTGILIAEDDDDDYLLTKKALEDSDYKGRLTRVRDGEELLAFLLDAKAGAKTERLPLLLLLDLNMPRKDGREALKEIKFHHELRIIPVVVLTTSMTESDIAMAYELGANSFIRKPAGFDQFAAAIKSLTRYWFETAELPRLGRLLYER